MSSIVVAGDTSGTITIAAPAVAGSGTLTLPVATDTLAGIAATQTLTNKTLTAPVLSGSLTGTYTLAGTPTISSPSISSAVMTTMASSVITRATAQTAPFTPNTSVDFTSIPSWVKRITVMFNGISVTTGGVAGSSIIVQIGYSGGLLTSTYLGATTAMGAAVVTTAYSNGFMIETAPVAARTYQGIMTLVNITGNGWCELHTLGNSDTARCNTGGGFATLSGVLDRLRITTVNGTDTFDAGSVNILYE